MYKSRDAAATIFSLAERASRSNGPLLRLSNERRALSAVAEFPARTPATNADFLGGQDDIFFTREGGEAYLKDLPNAEMHRLDSGHFAVEDCLDEIASVIHRFYDEKVSSARPNLTSRRAAL